MVSFMYIACTLQYIICIDYDLLLKNVRIYGDLKNIFAQGYRAEKEKETEKGKKNRRKRDVE